MEPGSFLWSSSSEESSLVRGGGTWTAEEGEEVVLACSRGGDDLGEGRSFAPGLKATEGLRLTLSADTGAFLCLFPFSFILSGAGCLSGDGDDGPGVNEGEV